MPAALALANMEDGEPEPARPAWMPTSDVLPTIVPAGRFLIRSQHVIAALSHALAYPNGCMLEVWVCARPGAQGIDIGRLGPLEDPFERLVFAVAFGDQAAAVMDDERPWHAPGQLVLVRYGMQVSAGGDGWTAERADAVLRLWLHPLPPPVAGTLSIVAPDLGPGQVACPLDGPALAAAAGQAQPYWP
jgi:hypothetical protein